MNIAVLQINIGVCLSFESAPMNAKNTLAAYEPVAPEAAYEPDTPEAAYKPDTPEAAYKPGTPEAAY